MTDNNLAREARKLYATVEDDLVAAWAADAQARARAYAVYGDHTEAPDREDQLAVAEWQRRCNEGLDQEMEVWDPYLDERDVS